jgi:hypothetical protein
MARKDNRWCLICNPKNRTLYWHTDEKTGKLWVWCNKCNRGYSLEEYCRQADLDIETFLSSDFKIENDQSDEVQAMAWPSSFVPLSDPRAEKGAEYIKSRGLHLDGDMYYDLNEEGIVFPYYFENHFCGAQIRFVEERTTEDGNKWKITTLPGTRLGLLFYGWNQTKLMAQVKGIIVTEGAFNALAIQQALNQAYGGVSRSPWRVFACSGSGVSTHQAETLQELRNKGYKVICASDSDEAGLKMYEKLSEHKSITHYAFCEVGKDWNDKLQELKHKEFAKYFWSCITPIDDNQE